MHQKHPFRTRKGDDGFIRGSASTRKGDGGFIRGSASTRKGDGGFRPAHLADRARLRCPWAAAGPGRTTRRCAKTDLSTPGTAGVEGTGGICRGAGGRRRGLAGLRDDAPSEARGADGSRAGRRPPAHTAAGPSGTRPPVGTQNRPATGAGRLSQYQRLIAGSRQCRGLRGHSPGERWKYRAWRQYPSRFPPCGDPRRRRWRSAWPSRQRSRRRCPRTRPGSGSEPAGRQTPGFRCR